MKLKLAESFKIAFSMYSTIPMPYADWNRENMRYAICFFPFVGVPIGFILLGWWALADWMEIGAALRAAVSTAIPLWLTGGIHLDGFCDTTDALSSHQTRERKLQILKDSHVGSFAVMGCAVYLLVTFALWTEQEFRWKTLGILAIGFVLSRSLSGLSVVCFRPAKAEGTLAAFSNASQKKATTVLLCCFLFICMACMLWLDWKTALIVWSGVGISFLYYGISIRRQFGGITGDLAGYFLQLCELLMLAGATIAQQCF